LLTQAGRQAGTHPSFDAWIDIDEWGDAFSLRVSCGDLIETECGGVEVEVKEDNREALTEIELGGEALKTACNGRPRALHVNNRVYRV